MGPVVGATPNLVEIQRHETALSPEINFYVPIVTASGDVLMMGQSANEGDRIHFEILTKPGDLRRMRYENAIAGVLKTYGITALRHYGVAVLYVCRERCP